MRRALLIAVALSSLACAAWDVFDGNALLENCKNWSRGGQADWENVLRTGTCVGYIWGVAGALEGSPAFCLSNGVQQNQVVDVVKRWLDEHPEVRHYSASSLVAKALKEKFPCN
jgi:Rap1a immunity proteins